MDCVGVTGASSDFAAPLVQESVGGTWSPYMFSIGAYSPLTPDVKVNDPHSLHTN